LKENDEDYESIKLLSERKNLYHVIEKLARFLSASSTFEGTITNQLNVIGLVIFIDSSIYTTSSL